MEQQEKSNLRFQKSIEFRTKKSTNPFLKYFYLGTKKHPFQEYSKTLYDKIVYRKVWRQILKNEKKGIKIHREWLGTEKFSLFTSKSNEYKKFCSRWWKMEFMNLFSRNYKTCPYDYSDIFDYLIISLTNKGIYQAVLGHTVSNKEIMHKCWEIRNTLIKAYKKDELIDYKKKLEIEKTFGIQEELVFLCKDEYIQEGKVGDIDPDKRYNVLINPKLIEKMERVNYRQKDETDVEFRKRCFNKAEQISEKSFEICKKLFEENDSLIKNAFNILAENIECLWD